MQGSNCRFVSIGVLCYWDSVLLKSLHYYLGVKNTWSSICSFTWFQEAPGISLGLAIMGNKERDRGACKQAPRLSALAMRSWTHHPHSTQNSIQTVIVFSPSHRFSRFYQHTVTLLSIPFPLFHWLYSNPLLSSIIVNPVSLFLPSPSSNLLLQRTPTTIFLKDSFGHSFPYPITHIALNENSTDSTISLKKVWNYLLKLNKCFWLRNSIPSWAYTQQRCIHWFVKRHVLEWS